MPTDKNGNYYISKDDKSEALEQRGLGVRTQSAPVSSMKSMRDLTHNVTQRDWSAPTGQYFTDINPKYAERIIGAPDLVAQESQTGNLQEAAAETQKAGEAIGNALLGNAVTAGTTFLNTFATIYGALFAPFAGSEEGTADNAAYIYNNPLSKGLRGIQNWANEALPIYGDAKESPTKFIAEFIKNAGFTEGTMLSNLVLAAIPYAGPILATMLGPLGEAAVEAGNSHDEKLNEELATQRQYYQSQMEEIRKIQDPQQRSQRIQELNTKMAEDYRTSKKDADRAANIVFSANAALLAATNWLEFGAIINRASRSAEKIAVKKAAQQADKAIAESGMQLSAAAQQNIRRGAERAALSDAKKRAGIELAEEGLKYSRGKEIAKAGLTWLSRGAEEGFEEFAQDVIQKVPYYYGGEDGVNHYAESVYDDQARETVTNMLGALVKATADVSQDPDTIVDVAMGFLTGAIGTPGLRSMRNTQGNLQLPFNWNGGVAELAGDIRNINEKNRIVNQVNVELFKDNKFRNLYDDLVKTTVANGAMEESVLTGDLKRFEDAKSASFYTTVRMMDKIGMTDHIKETVSSIVNMSDDQLEAFKQSLGEDNPLSKKSVKEVREAFQKAEKEINDSVDNIKSWKHQIEAAYGDQITEETEDNLLYLRHQEDNAYNRAAEMVSGLYKSYEKGAKNRGEEVINETAFTQLVTGKNVEGTAAEKETLAHISELIASDTDEDPNDMIRQLEDLPKVLKSAEAFNKEYRRITGNLAEEVKAEQERKSKAVDKNTKIKNAKDIASISDVQSARQYYSENRNNPELVKQMDDSGNPFIKRAKALEESVGQITARIDRLSIPEEQKNDIKALLQNFLNTANIESKVDTEDGNFGNIEVLRKEGEDDESVIARYETAIKQIKKTIEDLQKEAAKTVEGVPADQIVFSETPATELGGETPPNPDNNSGTPEVPTIQGGDPNNPVSVVKDTEVTELPENTAGVPNGGTSFQATGDGMPSSQTGESGVIARKDTDTDTYEAPIKEAEIVEGEKDGEVTFSGEEVPEGEIHPSVQEYKRKEKGSMDAHIGGENRFLDHTWPESQKIVKFLREQGTKGNPFNAFDFINSGKLEEYRNSKDGGKVYFGINYKLVNDKGQPIILQLIKIGDEYYAIGTNYENMMEDFNAAIRETFQDPKYNDGKTHVATNIETTIKEVMSGRNKLLKALTTFTDALSATISQLGGKNPLHIIVKRWTEITGAPANTRIDRNLAKAGTAYIAVPNARGGYNAVALVQKRIGGAADIRKEATAGNKYCTEVLNAAQNLAQAVIDGDRDSIAGAVKKLNNYVAIRKVDFILSNPGQNNNYPAFFIKECVVNSEGIPVTKDGKKQYVKQSNGKDYFAAPRITPNSSVEDLTNTILNALREFRCMSWVSKDFAGNSERSFEMLKSMSDAGYLATHAPEFITRAAWYKLNPVTYTTGEKEVKVETKAPVAPKAPTAPATGQKPAETQQKGKTLSASTVDKMLAMRRHGKPTPKKTETPKETKKVEPKPDAGLDAVMDKMSRVKEGQKRFETKKAVVLDNLRKILPQLAEEDRVIITDNLVSEKDGAVLNGAISLRNAVITLNSLSATGTEYHEAFHYVFSVLLNESEQNELYKEARQEYGKQYNKLELEEAMADAFQDYMITRQTLFGKIKQFFEKLMRVLAGKQNLIEKQSSLFKAIAEAKYAANEVKTIDKDVMNSVGRNLDRATIKIDEEADRKYGEFMQAYNSYIPKRMSYSDAKALVYNLKKRLDVDAFKIVGVVKDIYKIEVKKRVPTSRDAFKAWYIKQIGITPQELVNFFSAGNKKSEEPVVTQEDRDYMESVGISDDMMETLTKDEVEWFRENGHSIDWINQSTLDERQYAKSCS